MKLSSITKNHIQKAALLIDEEGTPTNEVNSQYYVVVNEEEYRFGQLVREAYYFASGSRLKFNPTENYREYVKSLGFEITKCEDGYNFFTQKELEFYYSIANEEYRKANDHQKHYKNKLAPVIEKLNYWNRSLAKKYGYKVKRDGQWLKAHSAIVKPYIWPRIYVGEDKDVFFNTEVNGEKAFVGFKLLYYYEASKKLSGYKIAFVEDYFSKNKIGRLNINFSELVNYTWEDLFDKCQEYFEKHKKYHDELKEALSKDKKIARLVWNSNMWVKPSGRKGKSSNESYESKNGMGHEEWLLNSDHIINGYKYAFLEPIHKSRGKYIGNKYDEILLYTIDGTEKKKYWVGALKNVEVIDDNEASEILKHYKSFGWYEEIKEHLEDVGLNYNKLDDWVNNGAHHLFNVKFRAEQIEQFPSEPIKIENDSEISSSRYVLLDPVYTQNSYDKQKNESDFSFESGAQSSDLKSKSTRKNKQRSIELEMKHNKLQESFMRFLQDKYGSSNVRRECKAWGSTRVDIVRKDKNDYIFYEIKTFNSLILNLRYAIGQLLEYSFYADKENAKELVLVATNKPDEKFKTYLEHLNSKLTFPLKYIQFDIESNRIVCEI